MAYEPHGKYKKGDKIKFLSAEKIREESERWLDNIHKLCDNNAKYRLANPPCKECNGWDVDENNKIIEKDHTKCEKEIKTYDELYDSIKRMYMQYYNLWVLTDELIDAWAGEEFTIDGCGLNCHSNPIFYFSNDKTSGRAIIDYFEWPDDKLPDSMKKGN